MWPRKGFNGTLPRFFVYFTAITSNFWRQKWFSMSHLSCYLLYLVFVWYCIIFYSCLWCTYFPLHKQISLTYIWFDWENPIWRYQLINTETSILNKNQSTVILECKFWLQYTFLCILVSYYAVNSSKINYAAST